MVCQQVEPSAADDNSTAPRRNFKNHRRFRFLQLRVTGHLKRRGARRFWNSKHKRFENRVYERRRRLIPSLNNVSPDLKRLGGMLEDVPIGVRYAELGCKPLADESSAASKLTTDSNDVGNLLCHRHYLSYRLYTSCKRPAHFATPL